MGFRSHDAFEVVLRSYAHPTAISDLDRLKHRGSDWLRYLEAFGTSCRDLVMILQQENQSGRLVGSCMDLNMNCPLVRALIELCGQEFVYSHLRNSVYARMINQLRTYGRPLPNKVSLLAEHEARVSEMYGEVEQMKLNNNSKGKIIMRTSSNNVRKVNSLHKGKTDWSHLSKISIKDLVLYDSHSGKYVEGKLIVDPFTPFVGTTTILEDSNGDVILVALYNFLPDGLYGKESDPVSAAKLPKGCTVRISEPFLKVFQDGSRGIRVDNPNDITVISSGIEGNVIKEEELLISAKNTGNRLVKEKMYNAAGDAYVTGIRKADLVPTLLSNRSQAYAMMNDWERSLADAAASLTMRPHNEKSWARYKKAIEIVSNRIIWIYNAEGESTQIIRNILRVWKNDQADESVTKGKDALALKTEGNSAFKLKQFARAAELYTSALMTVGETSRALLANWSLCSIRNCANLDAVAASVASIRIRPEAKAVVRLAEALMSLGEPKLCKDLLTGELSDVIEGSDVLRDKKELIKSADSILYDKDTGPDKSTHLPRWVGDIESFNAGAKGRGVRATNDLKNGQTLLIEPPLAMSETDSRGKKGKVGNTLATIDRSLKDPSQVYLRQAIILRSQREGVLSRIVDCLSDGANERPVTSLQDLMPSLESCKVLLPTHYEYMDEERVELTADRVDAIVNVNSFGENGDKFIADGLERYKDNVMGKAHSRLVPATSMFNHSARNNCTWLWSGRCSIIIAIMDIKAGDELTIRYQPDEEKVRIGWGIPPEVSASGNE
jgi:tetratricopeptide (TPR) repeat protein